MGELMKRAVVASAAAVAAAGLALTTATLVPSHHLAGALNPAVKQSTIFTTICDDTKDVHGDTWVARQRPPSSYTNKVKADQIARLPADISHNPADYQEDHIVSLDLGGAPTDPRNLRPQPSAVARAWDVDLEVPLARAVCDGILSLADAQKFERTHK